MLLSPLSIAALLGLVAVLAGPKRQLFLASATVVLVCAAALGVVATKGVPGWLAAGLVTLVGLLGTIIGLIKGFTAVAAVNPAEKAEMLSASISVAMNNTAFALMVAIPFLLIHAFLQARASEIVDSLEAAKITFLNLVQRLAGEQPRDQRTSAGLAD